MQVRANRVGQEKLLERLAGRFPREAAAAVSDVEENTVLSCRHSFRDHCALFDNAVAGAAEAVRDDIPGAQAAQDLRGIRPPADVDHHRGLRDFGGFQSFP